MKREDPERHRQISMKGALAPRTRPPSIPGIPANMTKIEAAVMIDEAQKLAKKILKKMDTDGALPENPIARQAMQEAVTLLASELPVKDKLAVIRTVLEYNMAKPAATSNINVKTAEDFLDELVDKSE